MILFASGAVAAMELFQRSQAAHADADQTLVAVGLAQRRVEELRNSSYASLTDEAKASISTPSGYSTYSRAVTVTTPYTNLKQVVVTVYWTAPGGDTSVSLSTYRSNS